jgi:dolichol-phosphate mannosyltransferase
MVRSPQRTLIAALLLLQVVAAIRVISRLLRTGGGSRIQPATSLSVNTGSVAVIVPVLDEEARLGPCLRGLAAQGAEVRAILVVDGGSTDATREVVQQWSARDARIRFIDASPIPPGWNGKPWGLHAGSLDLPDAIRWILTIDADVRPGPGLVASILAHADARGLRVMSVATPQRVSGMAEAPVHSSLLATLVYRYGIPGHAYAEPDDVQANGQCFLIDRVTLERVGGFESVRQSIVEDVSLARRCAAMGTPVGFYEPERSAAMVTVEMYDGWYDAVRNWSRSLPMRDRSSRAPWWGRMADMTLTMGVPVPMLASALVWRSMSFRSLALRLNLGLLATRIGTQAGMARAYVGLPPTHWLGVVLDPGVVVLLWWQARRRVHRWRGRVVRW